MDCRFATPHTLAAAGAAFNSREGRPAAARVARPTAARRNASCRPPAYIYYNPLAPQELLSTVERGVLQQHVSRAAACQGAADLDAWRAAAVELEGDLGRVKEQVGLVRGQGEMRWF